MSDCGRGELCVGYVSARGDPVEPFVCPRQGDEPSHLHCCGFTDFKYCCGDPVSYYDYNYTYMRALSIGLLLALSVVALTLVAFVVSVAALCVLFHCTKPRAAMRHGLPLEDANRRGLSPSPAVPPTSPLFTRSSHAQPRAPLPGITAGKPPNNTTTTTTVVFTTPHVHVNPISGGGGVGGGSLHEPQP